MRVRGTLIDSLAEQAKTKAPGRSGLALPAGFRAAKNRSSGSAGGRRARAASSTHFLRVRHGKKIESIGGEKDPGQFIHIRREKKTPIFLLLLQWIPSLSFLK